MYFPIRFDTFEAEFEALLHDVTIWDVAVERCLEISGPDGFRFAQLLTPRDLSKCAVGQAKYVLICDSDGGIVNDPVMTRMDENTFWFALASSDALLFARGLRNAYPDLDVSIREADVAPIQVQGPRSKELLRDLVGESILDLQLLLVAASRDRGASRSSSPGPAGAPRSATRSICSTPRAGTSYARRSWRSASPTTSVRPALPTSGASRAASSIGAPT